MKKVLTISAAGVLAAAMVLTTACGKERADREAPAFDSPAATLTLSGNIDTTTKSQQISSDLFGIFLEDINYAGYALDDNLLVNGSFEYTTAKYGWTSDGASITTANTDGVLKNNSAFADNVNPTYANVQISSPNGSISNTAHPAVPLAVKSGATYTFSAFIKATDYSGDIAISIARGSTEYASSKITVAKSNEWVKYSQTFTASGTGDLSLEFKLTFANTGSLSIDNVMLETNDSTVGFKNYLYNAISDLSPAFIRFPGGCVIEGNTEADAYDWKNSIGATTLSTTYQGTTIADSVPAFTYQHNENGTVKTETTYGEQSTRVLNTNLWQTGSIPYNHEYGIGFYEYFMLCESVGAKAIPIVNCGYSCQVRGGRALAGRHGNKVQDYIQDAKDLICFAKGSVNSSDPNEAYWAQVRTDMGHPAPFEMDYIGVGNEQWGTYYTSYYEKFIEAFRESAKTNPIYASVQPIVGNCTQFQHCEYPETGRAGAALEAAQKYFNRTDNPIDKIADYGVVDQHYYMNYTDFLLAATDDVYAGYTRPADGTKGYTQDNERYYYVFVGEYAANDKSTTQYPAITNTAYNFEFNGWMSALSEAALMTTFESNGDIVRLAAYAPMFANLTSSFNQWAVDMMRYDSTNLVRTCNYFVQQLFMKNAGDHKVTSTLAFASGSMPTTEYQGTGGATRTANDIYTVTSQDAETGDVIIKIVNAGEQSLKMNVSLNDLSVRLSGIADVTVLQQSDKNAVSSLEDGEAITPKNYTIGSFTKNTFGYEVAPYSVTAIRVRTK